MGKIFLTYLDSGTDSDTSSEDRFDPYSQQQQQQQDLPSRATVLSVHPDAYTHLDPDLDANDNVDVDMDTDTDTISPRGSSTSQTSSPLSSSASSTSSASRGVRIHLHAIQPRPPVISPSVEHTYLTPSQHRRHASLSNDTHHSHHFHHSHHQHQHRRRRRPRSRRRHRQTIFRCQECGSHLACRPDIVSKAFRGRHGAAYLFTSVVNICLGEEEDRLMTTGMHTIREMFCKMCLRTLGWKYEAAEEPSQKYKEGKFILETEMTVVK